MRFLGLLEGRAGRDCVGVGDVATPNIFLTCFKTNEGYHGATNSL